MTGVICGTGAYVPSFIMDNNDIAKLVDTSDAWIRERTGVARRHIAKGDTTVSMACEAARRALEQASVSPKDLDLILVSTVSSNVILPCTACHVQEELEAVNSTCFDINGACTGFVLAYNTAVAYLASGVFETALIIGSETLSNLVDWTDRGTCILFGDGAGAAVLKKSEGRRYLPVTHSDGASGAALTCQSRTKDVQSRIAGCFPESQNIDLIAVASNHERDCFVQMNGQAVFKFAVKKVAEAIQEVLERNKLPQEEVDLFILHQANERIIEGIAKRLQEPIEKFPMNLAEYGNTSSASIPILLDELNRQGILKAGRKYILAGFGAGLTWGATIVEW